MKHYYKILSKDLKHQNMQYKLGLNRNIEFFDSKEKYGLGIYFSDKKHIMNFLDKGTKIAKITIPEGNEIVKIEEDKYKSHEIYIEEIYDIAKEETIEWMIKEGININWFKISINQKLSEKFIDKYSNQVSWDAISINQKLSKKFIEKFKDKVYWSWISIKQNLSEDFIEKYSDKVDWYYISEYQKLSEIFISKYQDKVCWDLISRYQNLNKDFIEKHIDKINIDCLKYNKNMTKKIYDEINELKQEQNAEKVIEKIFNNLIKMQELQNEIEEQEIELD